MAEFGRSAGWLRRIFTPSVNPGTRFPDIVSDDVQLVENYSSGGMSYASRNNLGFSVDHEFIDNTPTTVYVWNTFDPPGQAKTTVPDGETKLNIGRIVALRVLAPSPAAAESADFYPILDFAQLPGPTQVPGTVRVGAVLQRVDGSPGQGITTDLLWLPEGGGPPKANNLNAFDGNVIKVIPPIAVLGFRVTNISFTVFPVTVNFSGIVIRCPHGATI